MKILVADDDAVSRRMLARTLQSWNYEVEAVADGNAAVSALTREEDRPTIAVLDWMMPGLDGLGVCRAIRSNVRLPFTYLILLSGRDSKDDVIEGLESGADDYLSKPYHLGELRCRIRGGERIVMLQAELQRSNSELVKLATLDGLTDRLNRRTIMGRLDEELARAMREQAPMVVCMSDIDHFKKINDTFGHVCGDAVLIQFSKRLADRLRRYDSIGRYGGEEFLCLLPGMPWECAHAVIDRFRATVAENPVEVDAAAIPVTASFGAAWLRPGTQATPLAIVNQADQALYRAKHAGRNRVELVEYVTSGR